MPGWAIHLLLVAKAVPLEDLSRQRSLDDDHLLALVERLARDLLCVMAVALAAPSNVLYLARGREHLVVLGQV
jgi:hypothetical protein